MADIAICDDNETMIYEWKNNLDSFFRNNDVEVSIELFTNPENFISAYKERAYDLIFLDILMPEVDGFEVAEALQKCGQRANIAFFTYVDSFDGANNAFLYKPVAYIRKKKIDEDLEKFRNAILSVLQTRNKYYVYNYNDRTHRIKIDDIYYFKSKGKYIHIYTVTGIEPIELRKTLKSVAAELKNEDMVQVNKGVIANIAYMEKIDRNFVYMQNGKFISIGRLFYRRLENKFTDYIGE